MRTLAIGDIHGCYRSLSLLGEVVKFSDDDRIITLGDYVDRGPDSRLVIEWLIERKTHGILVALRGNHEIMMTAARESEQHLKEWLKCGGDAVLQSYGVSSVEEIPSSHWSFLDNSLLSHFCSKEHFFVHANAYPDIPVDEQPDFMLYWESFGDPAPHESGLTMICGHTPQRDGIPKSVGHAICIDTWACGKGWLTCLDVGANYCWQANEEGETRGFWLDEGP